MLRPGGWRSVEVIGIRTLLPCRSPTWHGPDAHCPRRGHMVAARLHRGTPVARRHPGATRRLVADAPPDRGWLGPLRDRPWARATIEQSRRDLVDRSVAQPHRTTIGTALRPTIGGPGTRIDRRTGPPPGLAVRWWSWPTGRRRRRRRARPSPGRGSLTAERPSPEPGAPGRSLEGDPSRRAPLSSRQDAIDRWRMFWR